MTAGHSADTVAMTPEERRRLADDIEARVWPVIYPGTRDDIDLGQLRVNILDAVNAALYAARSGGDVSA